MIIIAGDIHGEFWALNALINRHRQIKMILQYGDFGWWPRCNFSTWKNREGAKIKNGNVNPNILTEEKEDLLTKYKAEILKYKDKFIETRKENLSVYLKESRYRNNNLDEVRKIYKNIKDGENDVYFMDILPTANYISKMNSNILEKYEFVVSKISLYEIQTKEDFEKKYSQKIIKLYYSLDKDYVEGNETITNIIKHKIIDKLFFLLIV